MAAPNDSHPESGGSNGSRGYDGFEGVVGRTAADSVPHWTEPRSAPPGAPNIVVVLIDDMGFSDTGPYGSEIDTPTLNRLSDTGYRFTNYHTAPLCSPSRAALLTGVNPHRAGYGYVANADPGFPGLRLELADDVLSLPEALRANGYATFAVGKWHLVRDANLRPGASKDSWPLARGFDRYYGSLEGLNSFFHPNQLTRDNAAVDIDEYPPGYYLTDDLTDNAVRYLTDLRAHEADKPFFLYFAHVAMHGPLQVPADVLERHRGRYDDGWDSVRGNRFAAQLASGLFPPGTIAAPRHHEAGYDVPPWDDLDAETRDRFARYMEVYAAMVETVDASIGRILETIDRLGELDNTIVVFTSDNGGTAEGGPVGTRSYFSQFARVDDPDWVRDVPHPVEDIGSERIGVHYPRGWGQVSNTPFRYYKGQTFAGGVRVPLLVSWPAGLPRDGGDDGLRTEYAYVTDLAPTLLDLAGLEFPGHRHGRPALDRDGVSFEPVLRDAGIASPHPEQYSEMSGHRGFYRDGWKLLSLYEDGADVDDPQWQLFDVRTDPTELNDLSRVCPEKVTELAAAWDEAAWHNTVFPLLTRDDLEQRRPSEARLSQTVRILPDTPVLERYRSSRLVVHRDVDIIVELAGHVAGDEGVLLAHGDIQGGYLLYIEDGRLIAGVNSYGIYRESQPVEVPAGARTITVAIRVLPHLRWSVRLSIDSVAVSSVEDVVQLVGMAPWTGISVGRDARGPVSSDLRERRGIFVYSGDLIAVEYRPGPVRVPREIVNLLETEAERIAD